MILCNRLALIPPFGGISPPLLPAFAGYLFYQLELDWACSAAG
jgi:hypothetical protein